MRLRSRKLCVILLLLLCSVLTAIYYCLFVMKDDRQAPEIQMTSDTVTVSVSADQKMLLEGVTATDLVDGDVTDYILIENIYGLTSENTATITYVAYDSAGNASKASRTVKFTDYTPPKFGQSSALVFASNTAPDVLSFMTAEDKFDGDISHLVKGTLISDTTSLSYPGEHLVEFRVTNSMGDTQKITLPVDVYEARDYNAKVELTDYLVYIKAGEEFNPKKYLKTLSAGNDDYSLQDAGFIADVAMKSDVDVTKPGVYSVIYTVNYDNRYTGFTRLNVVVEE